MNFLHSTPWINRMRRSMNPHPNSQLPSATVLYFVFCTHNPPSFSLHPKSNLKILKSIDHHQFFRILVPLCRWGLRLALNINREPTLLPTAVGKHLNTTHTASLTTYYFICCHRNDEDYSSRVSHHSRSRVQRWCRRRSRNRWKCRYVVQWATTDNLLLWSRSRLINFYHCCRFDCCSNSCSNEASKKSKTNAEQTERLATTSDNRRRTYFPPTS